MLVREAKEALEGVRGSARVPTAGGRGEMYKTKKWKP